MEVAVRRMPRQADGAREGDEEARRKVDATLSLQSDLERLDALLCDAETGGHTNILSARMMIARVCAAMQAVEAGRRRPAPRQSRRVDGRAAALAQENRKLRKALEAAGRHKETIRRQNREIVRLVAELRRLRDQEETVRLLSEDAYRLRSSLGVFRTQNGRLKARLAKLIEERKTFSKPTAGVVSHVI